MLLFSLIPLTENEYIHYHHHEQQQHHIVSVVSLTTRPQPLPKRESKFSKAFFVSHAEFTFKFVLIFQYTHYFLSVENANI
jgi:hypothetical protein